MDPRVRPEGDKEAIADDHRHLSSSALSRASILNIGTFGNYFLDILDNRVCDVHMHIMASKSQNKQRRDVTDVTACTCFSLRKASRAMTQLYDAALKPSGLRATQFNILAALDILGQVPQSELATALVMDRTTLIRNLSPLIAKGFVAAARESGNGPKLIALTAAGQRTYRDAVPLWQGVQERIATVLGAETWNGLIDRLDASVAAAQS